MKNLTNVRDKDVFSSDGEKIGSVKDIYYDDTTREPEWIGVGTGFLGMKEKVVPVENLTQQGDRLVVPFTKDRVQNEPDFDTAEGYIKREDEARLCSYFGLSHDSHQLRVLRYGERYTGTEI